MPRMFGTDGVRGIANAELTGTLAYDLGRAGAQALTQGAHKPTVIIGCDTRLSCDMLKCALMAGICSVGAHAVDLGVLPTPAIALLTRQMGADAGVVISASHNPAKYNGIKFFSREGYKLSDALEDEIEALVRGGCEGVPSPVGAELGRIETRPEMHDAYLDALLERCQADLHGLTIALDCANGAASRVAPALFARLGARVVSRACDPDGMNINLDCGSTHPEALQKLVVEAKADVGLAFDGDADRLIAVDEKGNIVDGDEMLVICGRALKEKGKLAGNTVVATVMSNMGLDIALRQSGIHVERAAVGDRYVLERMLQGGYVLGGEQSGHIIFLGDNTTGDGIQTALHLLAIQVESGRPLSELAAQMKRLPQVLVNVPCAGEKKHAFAQDEAVCRRIEEIEAELSGCGRVLVRPSGTEALVRVMLEGPDETMLQARAEDLASLLRARLS
ncbi:MAG: phosphoglucosamine mutase [Candidatus Spyradocola sp.]|jgi:phosphoglucosamine mutase